MGLCVAVSIAYYCERHEIDTNQRICHLLTPTGERMGHWYYRSDQFLATTPFHPLREYYGPIDEVPEEMREHISESRFLIDEVTMQAAELSLQRLRDSGKI